MSSVHIPPIGPNALFGSDTGDGAEGVRGVNTDSGGVGVTGFGGDGAFGFLAGNDPHFHEHVGVYGASSQQGVLGHCVSGAGTGVFGNGSGGSFGVRGHSASGTAIQGTCLGSGARGLLGGKDLHFHQDAGVYGESAQQGVMGLSTSPDGTGVYGGNLTNLKGQGYGVRADIIDGVAAISGKTTGSGAAILGDASEGTGEAGIFLGDVQVSGDVHVSGDVKAFGHVFAGNVTCENGNVTAKDVILSGGDCAEDFDIVGMSAVEPGTVMVVDRNGMLEPCRDAYDKKVTGVISGAGDYKPGIILDKRQSSSHRLPLALLGKVYCKVDAEFGPIEAGDLLTTSSTPGHAMKAGDPRKAFGSVIGKALQSLADGRGLIPILVALQ